MDLLSGDWSGGRRLQELGDTGDLEFGFNLSRSGYCSGGSQWAGPEKKQMAERRKYVYYRMCIMCFHYTHSMNGTYQRP